MQITTEFDMLSSSPDTSIRGRGNSDSTIGNTTDRIERLFETAKISVLELATRERLDAIIHGIQGYISEKAYEENDTSNSAYFDIGIADTLLGFLDGEMFNFSQCLITVDGNGRDIYVKYANLSHEMQELIVRTAYICATRDGVIDGRNWEINMEDLLAELIDTKREYGNGLFPLDDNIQLNDVLDNAGVQFMYKSWDRLMLSIYQIFIDYVTSPSSKDVVDFSVLANSYGFDFNAITNEAITNEEWMYLYENIEGGKQLWEIFFRDHLRPYLESRGEI